MTKRDLVNCIAEGAQISKQAAERALNALLDGIVDELKKGEKVSIIGFGTFSVKERAAREGRNPSNGQPIHIEATRVARFTAGKSLKDAIK
jgi:DNA-binding protein HU-beta